jgi:hypothetical protein
LRALEQAAHELADGTEAKRCAYREAQRAFRLNLGSGAEEKDGTRRSPGEEWLISDLVTLGSPLAHAAFLLARDEGDLAEKKARWLFPTDPPQFKKIESEQRAKIVAGRDPPGPQIWGPPAGLFSYFVADRKWAMHHAAPFAAVRWTNIHDPHRLMFQGDIISMPLRLEAAILSRTRSPISSRSNWAKDSSTLSVSRPMLELVLNDWVTETNETPWASNSSMSLAKSASERVSRSTL